MGIHFLKKQKKLFLVFSLFLNIFLIWQASKVYFDNTIWLEDENPHKKNKDYLYNEFEKGEVLVIGINLEDNFFQNKYIQKLSKITEQLENLENVLEVKNPLTATTIIQHQEVMEILSFQEALEKNILSNLEEYKKKFYASDYYGKLLSLDNRKMAILIKLDAPPEDNNETKRKNLIQNVNEILNKNFHEKPKRISTKLQKKESPQIHLTGEVRLNSALNKYTKGDLLTFLPSLFFLIFILLYFVFGRIHEVLAILYILISVLLLCFALFSIYGYPLTAVAIALPVLILVIAIADAIHIFNRWYEISFEEKDKSLAWRKCIKETWSPCLLTSLTTSIGFGSFYFSELIPLRNFAEISIIAILLAYVLIVSHMWFFLWFFQGYFSGEKKGLDNLHPRLGKLLLNSYIKFSFPKRYWILGFFLLLLGVSFNSFRHIRTETNFLDVFFKKKSQLYQDFEFVDSYLGGTGSVDILITSQEKEYFKTISSLEELEKAESALEKDKIINYVRSYLNPLRMIHKEFSSDLRAEYKNTRLPQNEEQLGQELLFLEFSRGEEKNDVLSSYIDFDYTNARIHLQTPNLNSRQAKEVGIYIENNLRLAKEQSYILTGASIYFQKLGEYVISTQIISVLITLLAIWFFFLVQFGFKLSILGVMANSLPILMTISIIIYLDIPFDFATVLISSVSFGLCVDDTIHFLHYYNLQKKNLSLNIDEKIKNVIKIVGQPIFFTSVLFSFGFFIFSFSNLVILVKFGVFTLLSLLFAFVANVLVLPSLLRLFDTKLSK